MDDEKAPEDRLEAALERIAQHVADREAPDAPAAEVLAAEVQARLDGIIATLRQALGK